MRHRLDAVSRHRSRSYASDEAASSGKQQSAGIYGGGRVSQCSGFVREADAFFEALADRHEAEYDGREARV
jgi:hypothetical protein